MFVFSSNSLFVLKIIRKPTCAIVDTLEIRIHIDGSFISVVNKHYVFFDSCLVSMIYLMSDVQYLLKGKHTGSIWSMASQHITKGTNDIVVNVPNPHLQEK